MIKNIKTKKAIQHTTFRKLAIGSWGRPKDPKYYTKIELDLEPLRAFLKNYNKTYNSHVSLNYALAKSLAFVFFKFPDLNVSLIRNKLYYRKDVSVFFHTLIKKKVGYDLLGITIENIIDKSLLEIDKEAQKKIFNLKNYEDKEMNLVHRLIKFFPHVTLNAVAWIFDFILYTLNFRLTFFNLPSDRYGSFGLSAVGALGFDEAYVPLFPMSRLGIIFALGKSKSVPCVEQQKVVVKKVNILTVTMDHRYFDGAHFAKPLIYLKKILQTPEDYL